MVSHPLHVIKQHCDCAPAGTAGVVVLWDWRKTKFTGDVLDGGQFHEGHFSETWSGKFCHRIKRLLQCLLSMSVFCCWRLLATYLSYGHKWAEVSLATSGPHFIMLWKPSSSIADGNVALLPQTCSPSLRWSKVLGNSWQWTMASWCTQCLFHCRNMQQNLSTSAARTWVDAVSFSLHGRNAVLQDSATLFF